MYARTTADNLNEQNMTNLAIKGIIGIQAMSEISRVSGMSSDSQHYAVSFNQRGLKLSCKFL
jgi:hypothetical protein